MMNIYDKLAIGFWGMAGVATVILFLSVYRVFEQ
jgi:hypothetical protein